MQQLVSGISNTSSFVKHVPVDIVDRTVRVFQLLNVEIFSQIAAIAAGHEFGCPVKRPGLLAALRQFGYLLFGPS